MGKDIGITALTTTRESNLQKNSYLGNSITVTVAAQLSLAGVKDTPVFPNTTRKQNHTQILSLAPKLAAQYHNKIARQQSYW